MKTTVFFSQLSRAPSSTLTEMVGLDSGGEVARFFFLEKRGNTGIIGKTDIRKHATLSHFLIIKRLRPTLHNSHQDPSV